MQTILEYIKKTKPSNYMPFTSIESLNDVDSIVKWLKSNDFQCIEGSNYERDMFSLGRKCYYVGPMDRRPDTHWIAIGDGQNYILRIRTRDTHSSIYNQQGKLSMQTRIGKDKCTLQYHIDFDYFIKILEKINNS